MDRERKQKEHTFAIEKILQWGTASSHGGGFNAGS
jgi:hypothetical protein